MCYAQFQLILKLSRLLLYPAELHPLPVPNSPLSLVSWQRNSCLTLDSHSLHAEGRRQMTAQLKRLTLTAPHAGAEPQGTHMFASAWARCLRCSLFPFSFCSLCTSYLPYDLTASAPTSHFFLCILTLSLHLSCSAFALHRLSEAPKLFKSSSQKQMCLALFLSLPLCIMPNSSDWS